MGQKRSPRNPIHSIEDGYVVYKRPYVVEGHEIAGRPYSAIKNELNALSAGAPSDKSQLQTYFKGLGTLLQQSAAQEFKKEQNLLSKLGVDIDDSSEEIELISQINIIINGIEQYKEILQRISNTEKKYKELEQYGKKSMAGDEITRAIIQTFGHTIQDEMARLRESLVSKVLTLTAEEIQSKVSEALERALLGAVNQTQYLDTTILEDGALSAELDTLRSQLESNSTFKNKFVSEMLNTFGFGPDKLLQFSKSLQSKTKKDFRKTFNAAKNQMRGKCVNVLAQRQMAGNLSEYVTAALANQNFELNIDVLSGASTVKSNMVKTDNILAFYTGRATVDLGQFLSAYTSVENEKTSQDTFRKMELMFKNIKNLEIDLNSYFVYSSNKTYGIGKTIGRMDIEKQGSILDSAEQIAAAGGNWKTPFLALQTAANGYLEGNSNVIEAYKSQLMNAMGQIMFDDWQTIGVWGGENNRIHVLNVDGVYVPLSVLMQKTSAALLEVSMSSSLFKISVHINGVEYRRVSSPGRTEDWESLWQETRNEALKSYYHATLQTTLLSKIDTLLTQLGGL